MFMRHMPGICYTDEVKHHSKQMKQSNTNLVKHVGANSWCEVFAHVRYSLWFEYVSTG